MVTWVFYTENLQGCENQYHFMPSCEAVCTAEGSAAEHLPGALMQHPDRAPLGVFRSFLSLPYCPTLRRVCTGAQSLSSLPLHRPCPPAQGSAWLLHGKTHPAGPSRGAGCRQEYGSDGFCWLFFVPPKDGLICPLPDAGRSRCLASWPRSLLCHLPQLAAGDAPTSPLSHGQEHPPAPWHSPRRGIRAQTPTLAPAGLSPSPPVSKHDFKEAGRNRKLFPPFFQPGTESRFAEQEPMVVEGGSHSKHELDVLVDMSESTLDPSCSTEE